MAFDYGLSIGMLSIVPFTVHQWQVFLHGKIVKISEESLSLPKQIISIGNLARELMVIQWVVLVFSTEIRLLTTEQIALIANPRNGGFNLGGHLLRGRLHWTDIPFNLMYNGGLGLFGFLFN